MARPRTGSWFQRKDGSWWARVTYTDETGKRRERVKKAESKSHAKRLAGDLVTEVESHGGKLPEGSRMTFGELADYYEKTYLIPPVYKEGRKVAGMRSHYNLKSQLKAPKEYFGKKKISQITYEDLLRYRNMRLASKTYKKDEKGERKDRTFGAVNRELSQVRKIFNVAKRNRWITYNPFEGGTLISTADEKPRDRILSRDEEQKLLAVCVEQRAHIRPIIICALDTGMRRGEILKLKWSDVDLPNRTIHIQAFNTKTMRERDVPITRRLEAELNALWERSAKQSHRLVFGVTDNFKKAFTTACRLAGIKDFVFRDCRHAAATRMIEGGMPRELVGRILGHTQAQTTFRYINLTSDAVERAEAILNTWNETSNDETVN